MLRELRAGSVLVVKGLLLFRLCLFTRFINNVPCTERNNTDVVLTKSILGCSSFIKLDLYTPTPPSFAIITNNFVFNNITLRNLQKDCLNMLVNCGFKKVTNKETNFCVILLCSTQMENSSMKSEECCYRWIGITQQWRNEEKSLHLKAM